MNRLIVALLAGGMLVAGAAFAQQPIPTPDQRLALEVAQLQLRNAYLTTDLDKAKAEIEALKAKLAAPPAAPKE